jgi:acyl-CoA synthetase (AMP-forming)/AMP-acid ligase II
LYVTGRLKDMIIVRGRNLYAEDIEQVAARAHHALIPGAAAAFSIPGNDREQVAIMHEVHAEAGPVNVDQVAQAIRRALAREMRLPVQTVVLVKEASLPRTASGKIQRYVCRAQLLASGDGGA